MEQEKKSEISFKPLTSGLGLDHFSDGLPYSPANSKTRPSVRFVSPPRSPKSMKTITPTYETRIPEPVRKFEESKQEQVETASFEQEEPRRQSKFLSMFFSFIIASIIFAATVGIAFFISGISLSKEILDFARNQLLTMYGIFIFGFLFIRRFLVSRTRRL